MSVSCSQKIRIPVLICQKGNITIQRPMLLLAFMNLGNVNYESKGCPGSGLYLQVETSSLCRGKNVEAHVDITWNYYAFQKFLGHYKQDSEKLFKHVCRLSPAIRTIGSCYTSATIDAVILKDLSTVSESNITNSFFCPRFSIMANAVCLSIRIIHGRRSSPQLDEFHRTQQSNEIFVLNKTVYHLLNNGQIHNHLIDYIKVEPQSKDDCLPSQFLCPQGHCISMLTLRNNDYQCSEEYLINDILTYKCKGSNILWLHVCDGVTHCDNGEDEELCPKESDNKVTLKADFRCSDGELLDLALVDDLVPDCVGGDDERFLYELALQSYNPHNCPDGAYLPCYPGHFTCFALHNLCKFKYDRFGHLRYCRNGVHLRDCSLFQCSGMFKCPMSYCISLQTVCDDHSDCLNGEDELNCDMNKTYPGMLLCKGGGFVHPIQLCDDENDCEHRDDEYLCGLANCPQHCTCFGLAMICTTNNHQYISPINLVHYKSFIGQLNKDGPQLDNFESIINFNASGSQLTTYIELLLTKLKQVVNLDVSKCQLGYVRQSMFPNKSRLHYLSLAYNSLSMIPKDAFMRCPLLRYIDLSNQQIYKIDTESFKTLQNLHHLDLSFNQITHLPSEFGCNLVSVDKLYINDNPISSNEVKQCKTNHEGFLVTDDTAVCCAFKSWKCSIDKSPICESLSKAELTDVSKGIFTMVAASIIIVNVCAIATACLRKVRHGGMDFVLNGLRLAGIIYAVHVLMVAVIHDWIPGLYSEGGRKHWWCLTAGTIQIFSNLLLTSLCCVCSVTYYQSISSLQIVKVGGKIVISVIINLVVCLSFPLYYSGMYNDVGSIGPACSLVIWTPQWSTISKVMTDILLCIIILQFGVTFYYIKCAYVSCGKYADKLHLSEDMISRRYKQVVMFALHNLLPLILGASMSVSGLLYSVNTDKPVSEYQIVIITVVSSIPYFIFPANYLLRVLLTKLQHCTEN